ncbi:MAG TPA: hypothetical protein VGG33_26345 [Polyangia bacterium]
MWLVGGDSRDKRWLARNQSVLALLGAALIAAGFAGFVVPAESAVMSGALAYNVFHLVAGACAVALLFTHRPGLVASFNVGFGLFDLWQVIAGLTGVFPATLFALRPADHVVHGVLGVGLVLVGGRGVAAIIRRPSESAEARPSEGHRG